MSKRVKLQGDKSLGGISLSKLTYRLVLVGLVIIVSRIAFTFALATVNGRQWYIEFFGILPVIAFNSDSETFQFINSLSTLLSSLLIFIITFYYLFRFSRIKTERLNAVAWVLGSLLIVIQYVVLLLINSSDRFAFNSEIGIIVIPVSVVILAVYSYIQKRTD